MTSPDPSSSRPLVGTSQSSTNGCRDPAEDDDDELDEANPKVAIARRQAKDDLARRERELGPVGNTSAWLEQATRQRLAEPAIEARQLYPDWKPLDLPDGVL